MKASASRLFIGILAGVLIGAAVVALFSPDDEEAERTAMPLDSRTQLVVIRLPTHFFLAEYSREIAVERDGVELKRTPINSDTGGTAQINVYASEPDAVTLVDRFDNYNVSLADGTVMSTPAPPPGASFLGAFDLAREGERREYRFIPAAEREERPVPPM
jgi:hypothetical protein